MALPKAFTYGLALFCNSRSPVAGSASECFGEPSSERALRGATGLNTYSNSLEINLKSISKEF